MRAIFCFKPGTSWRATIELTHFQSLLLTYCTNLPIIILHVSFWIPDHIIDYVGKWYICTLLGGYKWHQFKSNTSPSFWCSPPPPPPTPLNRPPAGLTLGAQFFIGHCVNRGTVLYLLTPTLEHKLRSYYGSLLTGASLVLGLEPCNLPILLQRELVDAFILYIFILSYMSEYLFRFQVYSS